MKVSLAIGLVAVLGMFSTAEAVSTAINVGDGGGTYSHSKDGVPQYFVTSDTWAYNAYMDGHGIYINHGTAPATPRYVVYKFVAPVGKNFSEISVSETVYLEGSAATNGAQAYYTTSDFTGTPDFSAWTNLNLAFGYGSYSTKSATFNPNSSVVYVAYTGYNLNTYDYQTQVVADQIVATVPEPATAALCGVGLLGAILGRRRVGQS